MLFEPPTDVPVVPPSMRVTLSPPTVLRTLAAVTGLSLLLSVTAAAQDPKPDPTPDPRRVTISCPGPGPDWVELCQAEDGHYPGIVPGSDLRATAEVVLAVLAAGESTMRSGKDRRRLKRAVLWINDQIDARGRLAFSAKPDWLVDHAVCTLALSEAGLVSRYRIMAQRVERPLNTLADHLGRIERRADPELLLWSRLCADSAAAFAARNHRPEAPMTRPSMADSAELLLARVRAMQTEDVPKGRRSRAARFLLETLTEGASQERLAALAEPFCAEDWPRETDDDLTVFYGQLALDRLAGRDPDVWAEVAKNGSARLVSRVRPVMPADHQRVLEERAADPESVTPEQKALDVRVGTFRTLIGSLYYRFNMLSFAPAPPK